MRRRRRHHYHRGRDGFPMCAVAFGVGLFVALCCSLKLTLLLVAVLLIYLGLTWCF